ncbi:probable crossover junction endonuclease EME2 [Sitophilus oryzae]|uniref:Probable crossover junction endonuclease EME2 n=1 Tax=Sitophilus oryzae TaxID=7048 RepID=A0A6J2XW24_SITOR|nr:probable crossover junction endonuclease EME2 [Sitophilus oryzae]
MEVDNFVEISSDSSKSDETIIVPNDDIDEIVKKYTKNTHLSKDDFPSTSASSSNKNFYSLDDFSDEDIKLEPLGSRIKRKTDDTKASTSNPSCSWRNKFSAEDFCEDSNDIETVLNRVRQLEEEQFPVVSEHNISKEVEMLISGDMFKQHSNSEEFINKYSWENSSEENLPNLDNFKYSSAEDVVEPEKKKAKKRDNTDKEQKKIEREQAKIQKAREKELQKLEKEQQKQLKDALKVVEDYIKPDKCMEYLVINIDTQLARKPYGEVVVTGLKSSSYNYKVSPQIAPNFVSWSRKIPTVQNNLLSHVMQQESHYLFVIEIPEFVKHVVQKTLIVLIQSFMTLPEVNHLTIALLGLPRFFNYLKNERNREFKASMQDSEIPSSKNTNREFKDLPTISKEEIDKELVELQIYCKHIYVRPVDKYEDLAAFVVECTKAVAQIPHKAAKADVLSRESEYFYGSNKDCVKVDKNGMGLGRLWSQIIRMFPLASLETAEAITARYPTMVSLLEAYDQCKTQSEGEKLLQDIAVRRAAGPMSTSKRIGPELSRKIYKFFTSEENEYL